jgi:hypothetical protein
MERKVLIIPIEELKEQFSTNTRKDIKIIAPKIMGEDLFNRLCNRNLDPEREEPLKDVKWKHTPKGVPNKICESREFADPYAVKSSDGLFCLAFANDKAKQDEHYHCRHLELYYSESAITAKYRILDSDSIEDIELPNGGVIVFGTEVIHNVVLNGLTVVVEFPAVAKKDKVEEKLETA